MSCTCTLIADNGSHGIKNLGPSEQFEKLDIPYPQRVGSPVIVRSRASPFVLFSMFMLSVKKINPYFKDTYYPENICICIT